MAEHQPIPESLENVAREIVDAAVKVHQTLGPGLLESVYCAILAHELRKRKLRVEVEVSIPDFWDSIRMEIGFRADMIIEGLVILEIKSVEKTATVHAKQLLTYLRLTGKQVGLLLNFGCPMMKDGIERVVNNYAE